MEVETCPHCGSKLPLVRDAFCIECGESLDEPPEAPRSPEEQAAFREQVEKESRAGVLWVLRRWLRLGGWGRGVSESRRSRRNLHIFSEFSARIAYNGADTLLSSARRKVIKDSDR